MLKVKNILIFVALIGLTICLPRPEEELNENQIEDELDFCDQHCYFKEEDYPICVREAYLSENGEEYYEQLMVFGQCQLDKLNKCGEEERRK
jgi:hypothetical protein